MSAGSLKRVTIYLLHAGAQLSLVPVGLALLNCAVHLWSVGLVSAFGLSSFCLGD